MKTALLTLALLLNAGCAVDYYYAIPPEGLAKATLDRDECREANPFHNILTGVEGERWEAECMRLKGYRYKGLPVADARP